jgi:hypothetical protein
MPLTVVEQEVHAYTVAYIPFTGGMMKFHPTVERLEELFESKGIRDLGKMSIYHDLYTDKRSSSSENDGGLLVDPQDIAKLDTGSSVYKIMTISAGKKMVITFPYKGA